MLHVFYVTVILSKTQDVGISMHLHWTESFRIPNKRHWDTEDATLIISSAKEFLLYPAFVHLSVCYNFTQKPTDRIFIKILPEMYLWRRKSSLKFGCPPWWNSSCSCYRIRTQAPVPRLRTYPSAPAGWFSLSEHNSAEKIPRALRKNAPAAVRWHTKSPITVDIACDGRHCAVRRHSRSPILVPIERPYATSY